MIFVFNLVSFQCILSFSESSQGRNPNPTADTVSDMSGWSSIYIRKMFRYGGYHRLPPRNSFTSAPSYQTAPDPDS